ncbi:hypothetical protein [Vitreoscilla stercoraria]|uniref:Uncharacterized protein n=1 Tax=Vitreoscilla stercoraria TaxID=61 RepID=A0ABY4EDW5_VITST|nr:hypothetical protein [Vitreoscilla stercoraria]UOO93605.1 hypothetical protein LVJ81_06160 [Vitreoscilla stercoraria]
MKQFFALLLIACCERSMQYNQSQVAQIEKALDYEMRHVPILKVTTREAIRHDSQEMIGLHWQNYQKWQARLKKVKAWAKD